MAKSDTERQRERRARSKARGETPVLLYLSRDTLRVIARLKVTHGSRAAVIDEAIRCLKAKKS